MDTHMTYDKEKLIGGKSEDTEEAKGNKFIWSYMIRPVRKDFDSK